MDPLTIGCLSFLLMLSLIFLGVPIAFAMIATACLGYELIGRGSYAEVQLTMTMLTEGTNFAMIAVPLYFLMGQLVQTTRMADDLFEFVYRWIGRLPGGVAVSAVIACGGFGAVSGGSITAVATIAPMSIPAMRKYRYDDALATGSIAAGATLGILIPPSIIMIGYGVLTESSIGALFLAGIVPGVLLMLMYVSVIVLRCKTWPALGPRGEIFSLPQKLEVLRGVLPILLVFLMVIGGIYLGVFTPTEAAGVGVLALLLIALGMRRLTWRMLAGCLTSTVYLSAMIFLVIVGGHMMAKFTVMTGLANVTADYVLGTGLGAIGIIVMIGLVLLLLGMVLDVWGMMILTVPFTIPIISELGYSPVWFGIFFVVMGELALITPPVGINVFVMHSFAPGVSLPTIFRGVAPFVLATLVFIVLLVAFPQIALFLPEMAGVSVY